jgi:hypothetical protein
VELQKRIGFGKSPVEAGKPTSRVFGEYSAQAGRKLFSASEAVSFRLKP